MFTGHQHLVKNFQQLIKRKRLAHGYIFFGEPQVGKFYFAKHLANFLETGKFEISSRVLQDALILENATGIEAMRELKNFLWQKPAVSPTRTIIIDNAGHLTPEAQNAILKITEEPPASSLLILITDQLENLIPTLLSRFQKIYFGRLKDEEMRTFLKTVKPLAKASGGIPRQNAVIFGAGGRPGRAMRSPKDPLIQKAKKYATGFLAASGYRRSGLIKNLVEEQKEKPELLDYFFEELILWLRQEPVKNSRALKSALHRLFLIKNYNTNKRIQLEAISE